VRGWGQKLGVNARRPAPSRGGEASSIEKGETPIQLGEGRASRFRPMGEREGGSRSPESDDGVVPVPELGRTGVRATTGGPAT